MLFKRSPWKRSYSSHGVPNNICEATLDDFGAIFYNISKNRWCNRCIMVCCFYTVYVADNDCLLVFGRDFFACLYCLEGVCWLLENWTYLAGDYLPRIQYNLFNPTNRSSPPIELSKRTKQHAFYCLYRPYYLFHYALCLFSILLLRFMNILL